MGFPTRVLSTAIGGLYTYAAPQCRGGHRLGPDQRAPSAALYRVEKFTRDAQVYGVIADPVRQSISPAVHNRAFQARRMDAVYLPFLVKPVQLKDFLVLAEKLPLAGFSVTIPHKQKILRYLDLIDPLARRIGAVNTVWRKAGKWRGTNTDVARHQGPAGAAHSVGESHGPGGRQRRRGPRRGLCAGRRRARSCPSPGRNPDRVRALAKACDAEPLSREQAEARNVRRVDPCDAARHVAQVDQCFFRTASRPSWYSTWSTIRWRRCWRDGQGAGRDNDSWPRNVSGAGGEAVRDLDRRNRAAGR